MLTVLTDKEKFRALPGVIIDMRKKQFGYDKTAIPVW